MKVFEEIFKGRELTIDKNGASINKWSHEEEIYIPLRIANYLINCEILILDGGNFDTGEEHYIYNTDRKKDIHSDDKILKEMLPILRNIRLNRLLKREIEK